jgi:hypothetical protein
MSVFNGELVFDAAKADGTPRKLLDVSKLTALGWRPRVGLKSGDTTKATTGTGRLSSRSPKSNTACGIAK